MPNLYISESAELEFETKSDDITEVLNIYATY